MEDLIPEGRVYKTRDFLNTQLFQLLLKLVEGKPIQLDAGTVKVHEADGSEVTTYISKELYNIANALRTVTYQHDDRIAKLTKDMEIME